MRNYKKSMITLLSTFALLTGSVGPSMITFAETVDSKKVNAIVEENQKTVQSTTDKKSEKVEKDPTIIKESGVESTKEKTVETTEKEVAETKTSETTATTETKEEAKKVLKAASPEKEADTKKETKKITILGSSDVHGNVWDYSYEDNAVADVGFARIGSIVKSVKAENPNTIIVDAGDNLQGTLLTDDIYSSDPEYQGVTHPVIAAMNTIGYTSMSLGNHEFNFGLDLIKKAERDAKFPLLSANTYVKSTGENFVQPYTVKTVDGVKIAVLGLTIPHVPMWDGDKVKSLDFKPLNTEAKKQVKIINEKEKPDVIVAAIHAGLDNSDPGAAARNVIKEVPEIDAFVLGHDHREFTEMIPDNTGKAKPAGAVKDTGSGVVRIDLELEKEVAKDANKATEETAEKSAETTDAKTEATKEKASTKADEKATDKAADKDDKEWKIKEATPSIISSKGFAGDEDVKNATLKAHEKTQEYVSGVVGQASANFLPEAEVPGIPEAQLRPTAMISLINNVQRDVTKSDLAASALFKADSKLDAGDIKYSDVFNIYKYPNTLVKAGMNGKQLKQYLENQAKYYQQYKKNDVTIAFNEKIRVYNYDIVSGVKYKIDISKPVGERIVDLTFKDKPVTDGQKFTMAMNNYRFEGMVKDGLVDATPLWESDPATLRGEIVKYIKEKGTIKPEEEIENSFEIIGADLKHPARDYIIEQVKKGTKGFEIMASKDGRTPNVRKLNVDELAEKGLIPDEYLEDDADLKFSIMHTNDMHGRLQYDEKGKAIGMAKLKTFKDEKKPTLMLDGGDSVQGLAISNFTKGLTMATAMGMIPYDGVAAGNHEFDFGYDQAMKLKEMLPMVSANTMKDGKNSFKTHEIVEKEGKKFAIIGLTTPETAFKTHPNNVKGVEFLDPIPVAEKMIKSLDKKADAFIFVTHLGIDKTTPAPWRGDTLAEELSKKFPKEKIIIIDGHSHSELREGKQYGNVLLAQTGNYLNNVGMIDVSYKGDKPTFKARLVPAAEFKEVVENPKVKGLVDETAAKFKEEMDKVVIENNPVHLEGDAKFGRTRETNLGNIIADSLYDYGQTGFNGGQTDLAVINGGGIRTSINQGKVTKADILAVLPFGNTIAQIDVTGKQLKEMFEFSLRSPVQTQDGTNEVVLDENGMPALGRNGGFLQVSHSVKVLYDTNKPGEVPEEGKKGQRVHSVQIKNRKTGKFEEVDDKKVYKLATNDFLAAGGDGYTMLGGKREEGPSMDVIFTDFLKAIAGDTDGKVVSMKAKEYNIEDYGEATPYSRLIPSKAQVKPEETGKKELQNLVTESKKLTATNFTAHSWIAFDKELKASEALMKEDATDAEYAAQRKKLAIAKSDLVSIENLRKAVADAEKVTQKGYTKDSWDAFSKELVKAKAMLQDATDKTKELTQDEVTRQANSLNKVRSGLVRMETKNPGTTNPSKVKPTKPTGGKLPQTGEKENFLVVVGLILLGSAGFYVYKRKDEAA